MFAAAVVLITTFVSPKNLDTWGGFVRVTGIISVAAVLYVSCHWGCCTCMRAFFRKTHCRLISAILNFFECSDRRHVCCVDGPDFVTL